MLLEEGTMIDVQAVPQLHRTTVALWHCREIDNPYQGFLRLVCDQHERNYRLWHEEDLARSPDASDQTIADVKRKIDKLNQQRNDLIEKLDDYLIAELAAAGVTPGGAPRNSETPGSIIDRLSILALRIYHMEEQAARRDVDQQHREKVEARLAIIHEQHRDLSESLVELVDDLFAGRKRLKVYRQFKMYNDPTLNPYLYGAKRPAA
jgi:cell division protein FtsB